jgi:hypothetical protein
VLTSVLLRRGTITAPSPRPRAIGAKPVTSESLLQALRCERLIAILEIDPYGEIVSIYVERDVDVLRVRKRTGRIMKASDSTSPLARMSDEWRLHRGSASRRLRRLIGAPSSAPDNSKRWDPISELHQGQRLQAPHPTAGHIGCT